MRWFIFFYDFENLKLPIHFLCIKLSDIIANTNGNGGCESL